MHIRFTLFTFGIEMFACSYLESPFEFRALEVALEAICSFLAARTTELEKSAYPALDELTLKVANSEIIVITIIVITESIPN